MIAQFSYERRLVDDYPNLRCMVAFIGGISIDADFDDIVRANLDQARGMLTQYESESRIPSIQQWRQAYRRNGTDPTKFRMAAESILRRLRTSDAFTSELHPFVVLCNSLSAMHALPVAALDADCIDGNLKVGYASGHTHYLGFDGETIVVPKGEITFEDDAGQAHARRWSHRQSAFSSISERTQRALVIAEALHDSAELDLGRLLDNLTDAVASRWPSGTVSGRLLSQQDLVAGCRSPFLARLVSYPDMEVMK
ncbi:MULTISPECIES: B3/4 domain-containing protein [Achromobacter]|uniref:Phenylalanine--tRNA ligase beta subunit-related protein n=1 Tax=Achromobacter spanius TaxID=217203 RepID=A0ABY8GLX7_9BURK|nr:MULTISPECIES: phenylalanine--tRNA ligase beta subunit-related protein [Achromobacter]WAI84917.1 phenylalanine--tRNA ligase beta subunit-related protein [Achromobacter spanius]WEX95001.1 phenylalanine--tRNA ligase beta subunit-related protein [Achromobacter sp. SS2-2022]WFP05831.1 phenylalanine--tRNA ligase beta subunit-related protein [Achromobacter spanius]